MPAVKTLVSILAVSCAAIAAEAFPVLNPGQLAWVPKDALPPGAHGAVVRGDPHQGPYAFFGRFPAKFTVPMHWHSNEVAVVMTEGAMVIDPDGGPAQRIEQGGYFFLPARMHYVATCTRPCTFLAWGENPFDIIYADPKDDPRLQARK